MASREFSKRLGTLSDEQLQAALDRFGLGRLLSAEPADGGLFGQNILIDATSGAYVFRGAPHWNPAREDDWQFQKERYFSRLVHEAPGGPVVPWPYLLDEGRDIFGWGFGVQPRLPGATLKQPMRKNYSAVEIAGQSFALGAALGSLHGVELPLPGTHDRDSDTIRPLGVPYADYVQASVEGLLRAARSTSEATTTEDVEWVHEVMNQARPSLERPFAPTVVHLDYGFHNVLFDDVDGAWRVTGIIDWHTAEAGHPESDLARTLATDVQYRIGGRDAFLSGYRSIQPQQPGFRERFPVFMLWERLLIWEYWQRNRGFKEGLTLRAWAEPYLAVLSG